MTIKYTKEFLIFELQRFHRENNRIPTMLEMTPKNNYPSYVTYYSHFGSWNKALEIADFEINQTHEKLTGFETCCKCGHYKKKNQGWITKGLPKGEVICVGCYQNPDYKNGSLNKESNVGKGTISEQIVKNVLNLEERHDCNFACGFGYPIDLYHKGRYKYINVKSSRLQDDNAWHFDLEQKEIPDTYVMLGYDENRKNILKVWITDAVDDLVFNDKKGKLLTGKRISNTYKSLKEAKPWEVDPKPYNDMLHKMSEKRKETNGEECFLNSCDLMVGD